jgi:hypothetical protein
MTLDEILKSKWKLKTEVSRVILDGHPHAVIAHKVCLHPQDCKGHIISFNTSDADLERALVEHVMRLHNDHVFSSQTVPNLFADIEPSKQAEEPTDGLTRALADER